MTTHEDHSLNEAIQASLKDFTEDTDIYPVKEAIREGGRSVAFGFLLYTRANSVSINSIKTNCNSANDTRSCLWGPSAYSRYS